MCDFGGEVAGVAPRFGGATAGAGTGVEARGDATIAGTGVFNPDFGDEAGLVAPS